jgi:UDP-2-acetamido-3-amino-2,3-dideoxy-glucuronate N-acetyltransferase
VGTTGKQIGWMCECGERLTNELECIDCGKKYTTYESGLKAK